MQRFITQDERETIALGRRVGAKLIKGDVIALTGDLGTGKTAFVKGIAAGLNIEDVVTSPTFTVVHSYEGALFTLHHFDIYRVHDEEELFYIGFDEYLHQEDICVIEWADLIKTDLPQGTIWVHLERTGNGTLERTITIEGLVEV